MGVRGGARPLFYYQLACEMTNIGYMRFAPGQNTTPGKGPREKRLERNRESARKCRRKRKAYVGDLEGKYQDLAEENAMLHLENERLQELVQQLQNGMGNLPQSAHKRVKSEFGVSMANDLSESAAGDLLSAGHLDYLAAPSGDAGVDDYASSRAVSGDTIIGV